MDFTIVNKFVSIAASNTINADARVSVSQSGGRTQDVRTTETSVFSRLMERTFRSDRDIEINRAARKELVDTLKGLFKVNDANRLPPAVRDAFVKDEVVCDRPLTRRRVSVVMTAAVRELGFKDMADFEKRLKMKAFLDRQFGQDEEAASEEEKALALTGDELDGDFDDLLKQIDSDEYNHSGISETLGFTKADLEAYYPNWKANVYAVSYEREQELANAASRQAPEQVNLERVIGNRKEAETVISKAKYILAKLDVMTPSRSRNDLYIRIRKAVRNALDCVKDGNPNDSAVKKAAAFLRGLKVGGSLHALVATVKSDGIDVSYAKMMAAAVKNIDRFLGNEADKVKNQTAGKSVDKAKLKRKIKNAKEQLDIAKTRMIELLVRLDPMGDDFLDLSNSMEKVKDLYDCASRITNEELARVNEKTTLANISNTGDISNMGNGRAELDDSEPENV